MFIHRIVTQSFALSLGLRVVLRDRVGGRVRTPNVTSILVIEVSVTDLEYDVGSSMSSKDADRIELESLILAQDERWRQA